MTERPIVLRSPKAVAGLVSTIIPVFNRPRLVLEAVASVIRQTYSQLEVIVVDDGSTDETPGVLDSLAREHTQKVHLVQKKNEGPGMAREVGRQVARGEFIQYLDSDDRLAPIKFEIQVSALREHPECGAAYGKTRCYRVGEAPRDEALKRTGERIDKMFPAFLKSRWWSTSTPLFRRTVVEAAGPWTNLLNEEDWEYDCRVAALGVQLCYCDEFVSDTRDHGGIRMNREGSTNPRKLSDRAKARRLIYEHAVRARVSHKAPEMQVFARYAFLLARQCGIAGLTRESRDLVDLAIEAGGRSQDLQLYRQIGILFGWRTAARLAALWANVRR